MGVYHSSTKTDPSSFIEIISFCDFDSKESLGELALLPRSGVDFRIFYAKDAKKSYKIESWDISGDPMFASIRKSYYRSAHVNVIMYSVSDRASFEALETFYTDYKEQCYTTKLLIVANKADLKEREVSYQEGIGWARSRGAPYLEISVKSKMNLPELVQEVVRLSLSTIMRLNLDDPNRFENRLGYTLQSSLHPPQRTYVRGGMKIYNLAISLHTLIGRMHIVSASVLNKPKKFFASENFSR